MDQNNSKKHLRPSRNQFIPVSAGTHQAENAATLKIMLGKLYIGAPVWACEHWRGSLFTRRAKRADWLKQYSAAFNTVEGNSTFYGLPSLETATRWAQESKSQFRFSLKTPRAITHDRRLQITAKEIETFIDVLHTLEAHHRLGPTFIQLPPDFCPREFDALQNFLQSLPTHLDWAVEVRHHDWYDRGQHEQQLDALLTELRMDKVIFDSRPLFSKPPSDSIETDSQRRKPQTPLRTTVTGRHPFLRLVGRNNLDEVQPWIAEWAPIIASWLKAGLSPFVFTHAPDDRYAPEFARRLHREIRQFVPEIAELPKWAGYSEADDQFIQRTLF